VLVYALNLYDYTFMETCPCSAKGQYNPIMILAERNKKSTEMNGTSATFGL
jgi:hypothetical protein